MKILLTPFVKFWNWFKETAWVQPLALVGLVFAIIFSMQPLVSWITTLNSTESETNAYFERFKHSLEGALTASGEDKSNAGKLMSNIIKASAMADGADKTAFVTKNLPAEKFFLSFVGKSCTACQEAKSGFEVLEQNWNTGYYKAKNSKGEEITQPFAMASIFVDEKVTNDTTNSSITGFEKFVNNYPNFFDESSANIQDTPYYIQGSIDKTKLGYFEAADVENFQTPTILLIDFTETGMNGASQLMFNVASEGTADSASGTAKARTLIDCWNGTGDFELKNNK